MERELRLLEPSSFSKPDSYNQAVLQVQGMKNLLKPQVSSCSISGLHTRSSSPTEGNSGDSKKCCQKGLPCWFVFVGWFLVVATSGVSAYFTMIYGLTYGKERSISWLISMVVSFFESLFITQPVKVRDGRKNTIYETFLFCIFICIVHYHFLCSLLKLSARCFVVTKTWTWWACFGFFRYWALQSSLLWYSKLLIKKIMEMFRLMGLYPTQVTGPSTTWVKLSHLIW